MNPTNPTAPQPTTQPHPHTPAWTPGPWHLDTEKGSIEGAEPNDIIVRDCRSYSVANAMGSEANARLIAAAPELAEALEMLLKADDAICENMGRKSDQAMNRIAALDNAVRVLAEAKGE